MTAVQALGRLKADPKLVAPALIRARADKELRHVATVSLGEVGSIDGGIVPALILSLSDADPNIRHLAGSAILKIGPAAEAAVPALIDALDEKPVNFEVLLALEKIGPKAKLATPALIGALEDGDWL